MAANDMQNNDPNDIGRKGGATPPATTASSVRAYDRPAQANPIAKFLPFIIGALVLGMLFALASRFRNNDATNNATQSAPAGNNGTMNSSSSQSPGPHSNAPTAGGNTMGSGAMGSGAGTTAPPGPTPR